MNESQAGRERVSIIIKSGRDLGGMSLDGQTALPEFGSPVDLRNERGAVPYLHRNWDKGAFPPFLNEVEALKSIT